MSVLIKGMAMPKSCLLCPFGDEFGKCCVNAELEDSNELTHSCPLVELPDHGDLVDESEKVDAQYYDDEFGEWSIKTKTVGEVLSEVCEAPPKIVIPAERSEEGSLCGECDRMYTQDCCYCERMERSEE